MKHECEAMKDSESDSVLKNAEINLFEIQKALLSIGESIECMVYINYCPWCGEKL